jgi:broad specificity polyphosphatase/5'/3'-nucleotidase SurE
LDEWHANGGRSDYEAVMEGYVSVTPLQADLTDYQAIDALDALLNTR